MFYIERANLVLAGHKLNLTENIETKDEYEDDILDPPSASFVDLFYFHSMYL